MQTTILGRIPQTVYQPSSEGILFSCEDKRTKLKKVKHLIRSIFRELISDLKLALPFVKYTIPRFRKIEYCSVNNEHGYDLSSLTWNNPGKIHESKGLYVLIHGLKGHPCCWDNYINQIKEQQPCSDCFVPNIKDGGNNSLEEIANPILEAVRDYVEKNPGKPICLIGVSNGTRIAGYIERNLMLEKTAIKTISIAGVHFGTKIIDKLERFKLLKILNLHPAIVQDFKYGSETAKKYLDEWRESDKLAKGERSREFYATTEDDKALGFESGLPIINGLKDTHIIIHGESHNSIVDALQKRVLGNCKTWMENS